MIRFTLLLPVCERKDFPQMLARCTSYTTLGLDAYPVAVEVDITRGLPGLRIVGLPDQAVREAKERVRSAILNSQYPLPSQRVTVNLAPADIKKEGGVFDLAIALGMLAASGHVDPRRLATIAVMGELALDGSVRPIRGALTIAMALRQRRSSGGRPRLLLPASNAAEASVVGGLEVIPVAALGQAVEHLAGTRVIALPRHPRRRWRHAMNRYDTDFADVKGQAHAKRALEIAVAGGHHALLIGPPGAGKTMLAQRLPTILPDLSLAEALEVTRIHGLLGRLDGQTLVSQRPFRAPHHTSSAVALIGGGTSPKPGEVSLAHHGVLFLDELPEFHRPVLESLREPLDAGLVHLARAKRSVTFPARCLLLAAMNPCPCGYLTDPSRHCRCSTTQVQRYRAKLSGPLLDRIDLHIEVPALPMDALTAAPAGEASTVIKARIACARARRRTRLRGAVRSGKARRQPPEHRKALSLTAEAAIFLRAALKELHLSVRAYDKVLTVARTIADLADSESILPEHVAEAMQYRSLDRQG